MEVAFINQGNLRFGALKGLGGHQAAKPAAEDEDTMFAAHVFLPGNGIYQGCADRPNCLII
jgi:hypothetical protein